MYGGMCLVCGSVCQSAFFGPFARLRHFQGLMKLLKDRFRTKNRLYTLDDCSNHTETIKTALSSILQTVRVHMQKDCVDGQQPYAE